MTKTQALELIKEKIQVMQYLGMASALFHWDSATTGVPEKSLSARGAAAGWLGGESFRRFLSPDTFEAVETLNAHTNELTDVEKVMTRELSIRLKKFKAVPPEEFQAFMALRAESEPIWETAREKRDYAMILPYYEKIFDYQRRLCDWYGYENHPYDALLDDYERGANVEMLDKFFGALRKKISPLLKDIIKSGKQPKEITGLFDINKQRSLMPWLTTFIGFDLNRGKVGEVEHPFCITLSPNDVRITTKYHEDNLMGAIYSIIHESGHGVYEQNMDEALIPYGLADCASMGVHESQSRLYENTICRSRAFAEIFLPKLRETFDYFNNWDEDMLYRAVNVARPSLIRIEADELTYSLHIMVRYELEKALITGDIKAADLPGLWDDKYEELLGVRADDIAKGVLQDVHWGAGLFGYFPSYAVGTAYGVQLVNSMKKSIDIDAAIRKADLSSVNNWLKDKVHKHGQTLEPKDLLLQATGEDFNPDYYVDYLSEKFTSLYDV